MGQACRRHEPNPRIHGQNLKILGPTRLVTYGLGLGPACYFAKLVNRPGLAHARVQVWGLETFEGGGVWLIPTLGIISYFLQEKNALLLERKKLSEPKKQSSSSPLYYIGNLKLYVIVYDNSSLFCYNFFSLL